MNNNENQEQRIKHETKISKQVECQNETQTQNQKENENSKEKKSRFKDVAITILLLIVLVLLAFMFFKKDDTVIKIDGKGIISTEQDNIINDAKEGTEIGFEVPIYTIVENDKTQTFIKNIGDLQAKVNISILNSKTGDMKHLYTSDTFILPGHSEELELNLKKYKEYDKLIVSDSTKLGGSGIEYVIELKRK